MRLSSLQQELLLALYEPQRRYAAGDRGFDSTVWGRAAYELARRHEQLLPSPARGQHNMARDFEARINRAAARLVTLGLAERRSIRGPDAPARYAQGYKRHRARARDLMLTEAGLAEAEARMRRAGMMAAPALASCHELPDPAGPTAAGEAGCED